MRVAAITLNTMREAIRNKILYSIFLFACLITGISAVLGAASIGDTLKFVKDFSLFSISLFGVVTTVVLGVTLLSKELGKRTIYTILSKPVGRWEFLVGKYLGLFATLAIMLSVLGGALLFTLWCFEGTVDWSLIPVIGAMLLELSILLAAALLFSSIVVTPGLAGFFTAATFVAGRSAGLLSYFESPDQPEAMRSLMHAIYVVLPHLDRLYVADRVVSGIAVPGSYYLQMTLYAMAYSGLLLALSVAIFRRREFI